MIEVGKSKAYSVQGIEVNGVKMISLRQMYKKRNDPNGMPGKQGITIPVDLLLSVVKEARSIVENDEYEEITFNKD